MTYAVCILIQKFLHPHLLAMTRNICLDFPFIKPFLHLILGLEVTWQSKVHLDNQPEKESEMFIEELSRKPGNVMKVCSVKSFLPIQTHVTQIKRGLRCIFQVFESRRKLFRSEFRYGLLILSWSMNGTLLDRLVNEKVEWASLMYDSMTQWFVNVCVCAFLFKLSSFAQACADSRANPAV